MMALHHKHQGTTKVIRIHPLWTINVRTQFDGNPSSIEIFPSGPKWWTDALEKTKQNKIFVCLWALEVLLGVFLNSGQSDYSPLFPVFRLS